MQRRAVLQSLAGVTAATAAGLAGCNTTVGGDGCGTPNGDLEAALPRGNDFGSPSVDTDNNGTEVGGARDNVLGGYVTDEETYLFVIGEYDSEDTARTAARTRENWVGFGYDTTGYIVVDAYAYVAMGPDEGSVTELMADAGPLDSDCANDKISFL